MRILILGGTGFIGANVIHALRGHEIIVFSRGIRSLNSQEVLRWIRGDRLRLHEHRAEFAALRPDVVLDMIPQNGVDALAVADSVAGLTSRLVMISSASVYGSFGRLVGCETGPVDNTPSAENAPLRKRRFPYRGSTRRAAEDPLHWLDDFDKIPAEEAVLSHPALQANVVRLPMVYGPGDPDRRIMGYLGRMSDGCREIILSESAANWCNSRAYVENVGDAIASVVVHGKPGRIYNVADRNQFSEAEWIRQIGVQFNWSGVVHTTSEEHALAQPFIDELPAEANFAHHLVMDDSLIRLELGYQEVVSLKDGLRRTIADAKSILHDS